MKKGYSVYVKLNENNVITSINSEIFIKDFEGWTLIDENVMGDRGAHCQGHYLPKGLFDEQGRYNYKWYRNKLVELTDEEKEVLFPKPTPQPIEQEIINAQLMLEIAKLKAGV